MIITSENHYRDLETWFAGKSKVLLVCDVFFKFLDGVPQKLDQIAVPIVRFSDFQPNPLYESVVRGVELFRREGCDAIMAVGGGSAIDVAKCIRLYAALPSDGSEGEWLTQTSIPDNIPFLAMPTTAGTGSEATMYAVIYYQGVKQSITSNAIIPDTILMDPNALKTLPLYQRKATMMDALCHAIESFWSVNSTKDSKRFSSDAIKAILEHMDGYLANTEKGNAGMLMAAHMAGKAINITQTTAGHAMCYKITSLFGCAHGHAAILCDRVLFHWMIENLDGCVDPRGQQYLRETLDEIGKSMGCIDAKAGAEKLSAVFDLLNLTVPTPTEKQFAELRTSVNPVRLKNHPIELNERTIDSLYRTIMR